MKPRILIDGTPLTHRTDGLSQYIKNVVLRLDAQLFDYTLIVRQGECDADFLEQLSQKNIATEQVKIAPIGPLREWQFYKYLRKNAHRFDAAIVPSNQFPVALKLPCIYIVHDLIYEEFPEQLGRMAHLKRLFLHCNVALGVCRATQIVAVSNYTKNDLLQRHSALSAEKISVVYEGWEHLQNIVPADFRPTEFERYFVYVGSTRGHKNLARLVDAIDLMKDNLPKNFGFVFVGSLSHLTKAQKAKIDSINAERNIIKFTGWVSETELAAYTSHAEALIFPSLSEGFGIPVLEAFYYKLPLLLARRTALPEVAGNAAIYFDPFDVADMAEKISNLAWKKIDTSETINLGCKRLKQFSWTKTANQIEQILVKICKESAK